MNAAQIVSWAKQKPYQTPPKKGKNFLKKNLPSVFKFWVGDGGVRPQRIRVQKKCILLLNKQDQS
jgi:hypothetical protein